MKPVIALIVLLVSFVLVPTSAVSHSILGHELEMEAQPMREGEKPVIPLDTSDPSCNVWRTLRDLSKDPKREPGIINLQKYAFGFS